MRPAGEGAVDYSGELRISRRAVARAHTAV